MKTIKDIFSKIIKFILKITGDDLSIYAAQASFFIIISVIPFSMLVLSIIKLFINIDINSILHTINSFAPAAISTFLTETITDLFTKSGSVQVISVTAVLTQNRYCIFRLAYRKITCDPAMTYFCFICSESAGLSRRSFTCGI